jgi:predicted esterase
MREFAVAVTTHGRVLLDEEVGPGPIRILAGFHGYAQNADEMMEYLRAIPAGPAWTRVSIQALHRFYRGRSEVTVASWMTRQDRELLVRDNVAYVDAALTRVAGGRPIERLVTCGFSQGVAMAFRAAVLGARRADAILALGGDVPPELLDDAATRFPPALLARGTDDDWYNGEKLAADQARLQARGAPVETMTFDGAHEWHVDFAVRAAEVLRLIG